MMDYGYGSVVHKLSKTPKWASVAFPSEMVEAIRELIEELEWVTVLLNYLPNYNYLHI